MLIVAVSIGLGLGVAAVPEVLQELPKTVQNIIGSPVSIGAFSAIILSLFLPDESAVDVEEDLTESSTQVDPDQPPAADTPQAKRTETFDGSSAAKPLGGTTS
jgi:xanthine permease XanP